MSTTAVQKAESPMLVTKKFFESDTIKKKFTELLGQRAQGFITSVLQVVATNKLLQDVDPQTIYHAAATAAVLDLPINQNLGFAYIVPYKGQAQFQMGWKGYVQLAQRTGLYKTINTAVVHSNQIESVDYLTGEIRFNGQEPTGEVSGFIAYFRLNNGFEKSLYMSKTQMKQHAMKYSQSYKKNSGVWADGEDGFNAMGMKTVLKLLISKYGPMSIEMQRAVILDQAVVKNEDGTDYEYIDTEADTVNPEITRFEKMAESAKAQKELDGFYGACSSELRPLVQDIYDKHSDRILNESELAQTPAK